MIIANTLTWQIQRLEPTDICARPHRPDAHFICVDPDADLAEPTEFKTGDPVYVLDKTSPETVFWLCLVVLEKE